MRRRESRFEVILEGTPLGLAVSVQKDGREVTETAPGGILPPEIAYLVRSSYKHDISIPLVVFLKRAEGRYPVYYGRGPARRRVEWLGDMRCPAWTEL